MPSSSRSARDTPPRGTFECSDPALNRFHENVLWSQRDNFVVGADRLPAARRAARLDRRCAGVRAQRRSTLVDAQAFWRAGCGISRSTRTRQLRRPERRARTSSSAGRCEIRPGWLGGCRHDRALGGPRRVRRPGGPGGPMGQHASLGRFPCRPTRPRRSPRARPAIRRLARPRRAAGPAVACQGGRRLPGERVLRSEREARCPTRRRLLAMAAEADDLRNARRRDGRA